MARRVMRVIGLLLAIGLVLSVAGCGGPPDFHGGPGKVRASPIPAGHGEVSYPANVTVDGTGLFVFTHGVRPTADGGFEANLSAVPNPVPGKPAHDAVQAWLGKGQSMEVAGLKVTVLDVYPGDGESGYADLQVTADQH